MRKFARSLVEFFRGHPVVTLALLTPGIPEYLSGSSPLNALVLAPATFLLQLALNLGLYLPGVLLVREAVVRWHKGWASLALLGVAYGLVEEGIALSTLFNPHAGPVGDLGFYGHFAGVNWVWTTGLLMFHSVFSVTIPILLLGLAVPKTRGHPLVGGRGLVLASGVYVADVGLLFAAVYLGAHFWMGWPILLGTLATASGCWIAAYRLPRETLAPRPGPPSVRPRWFAVVGFSLFPGTLLIEAPGPAWHLPAAGTVIVLVLFYALFGRWVFRSIGDRDHRRAAVALVAGALTPVCVLGVVAGLPLPLDAIADALLGYFLYRLWSQSQDEGTGPFSDGVSSPAGHGTRDGTPGEPIPSIGPGGGP